MYQKIKAKKKLKFKGKAKAERVHARKRALQRFQLNLTDEDISKIIGKIRRNETVGVRQSIRVTRHTLSFDGKEMTVVYDRIRKQIITFLYTETT